jgi:BirA family biotin operon repressor/biotin-[acetyl-CoA-carboxylase] ligase
MTRTTCPVPADPALSLLAALADGQWHGGPGLSEALGVSRAAIWKQVEVLRAAGVEVRSDPREGYRLDRPIAMLDARRIAASVSEDIEVRVLERCASTNLEVSGSGFAHRWAVLAEWQQAGRGRRGRDWLAPPGGSLALSFAYRFGVGLPRLGPLSLVAGLACAEVLHHAGVRGVGLKWPNDLLVDGRKLAGLLVELQGSVDGPCNVVIGIGLNAWLSERAQAAIDQAVTDLVSAGVEATRRNDIASALISALDRACDRFQRDGFAPFRDAWARFDRLEGRAVDVHGTDGLRTGIAAGVSDRGGLWLLTERGREELVAGEVSLRVRG